MERTVLAFTKTKVIDTKNPDEGERLARLQQDIRTEVCWKCV